MILDPRRDYVPVLKLKLAEKQALRQLSTPMTKRLAPIIELVPPSSTMAASIERYIANSFKGLLKGVASCRRLFLDIGALAPYREVSALAYKQARDVGLKFTPVLRLAHLAESSRDRSIEDSGVALRIGRREVRRLHFDRELARILSEERLTPEKVDVILDMAAIEDMLEQGVAALAQELWDSVGHQRWRSLTLSGCAFPLKLANIDSNSTARRERLDWEFWRRLHARGGFGGVSLPLYSDCGIQHLTPPDETNPQARLAAPVIRYAGSTTWCFVKGESQKVRSVVAQSAELAQNLVKGTFSSEFQGARHCRGCSDIERIAAGTAHASTLQEWRRIGTVHHIAAVLQGIDRLAQP